MNKYVFTVCLLSSNLAMCQNSTLKGDVSDANGKPVDAANVELVKDDDPYSNRTTLIYSDDQGKFDSGKIYPGRYRIYAWKKEEGVPPSRYLLYAPAEPIPQVIVNDKRETYVHVTLPKPNSAIGGLITDSETSQPVSHAWVKLSLTSNPKIDYRTSASADGTFVIYLPPRAVTLTITAPGYQEWSYSPGLRGQNLNVGENKRSQIKVSMKKKN